MRLLAAYCQDASAFLAKINAAPGIDTAKRDADMGKALESFTVAARSFDRAYTIQLLTVGRTAQEYLRVRLAGETDAGAIRTSRAAGVRRLQSILDDQCGAAGDTPSVEKCIRLYGVAEVFGHETAARLGIGQLRPFAPCLERSGDALQEFAFDRNLSDATTAKIKTLWSELATGKALAAADVLGTVQRILGKTPVATKADTKVSATKAAAPADAAPVTYTAENWASGLESVR